MSLTLSLLNVCLFLLLAWRLEFYRLGLFTYGFFALGTNILPHYILMPLYQAATRGPVSFHSLFDDGLMVISTMLLGICAGVFSASDKRAPVYWRLPEVQVSLRVHAALLGLSIFLLLAVFSVFTGSLNPFEAIANSRSTEFRVIYAENDSGYSLAFALGAGLFLHGWLLLKVSSIATKKRRRAIIVILATVPMVICTAQFGSRLALFSPILTLLFVFHHKIRRIPTSVVASLFVMAVPIFVLIRIMGAGQNVTDFAHLYTPQFIVEEFLERFQAFAGLLDFLEWMKQQPLQFGRSLLDFPLRPIPRSFLPDKPSSSDVFFSYAIYGQPYYGGGVQIFGGVAEFYYNFAHVGVFLWFVFVGRLIYAFHFGFSALMSENRTLAATMMVTNYGLMRGLGNLGVNSSGTAQIIMTAFAQCALVGIVVLISRNLGVRSLGIDSRIKEEAVPLEQT